MIIHRPFPLLLLLLFIKAVLAVGWILFAGIGLGPDEAQYWTWSKYLDWGYYSKPPGIAWQIWAGTQVFGDTELGVRFGAVLVGFLLPLAVYWLALRCGTQALTAFWAALVMAFSPLGVTASLLAITDGGLVLFWTLSCALVAGALRNHQCPSYGWLGVLIALGALFKWPIYLLWVAILALIILYPWMRSPQIFWGLLISLIGLLPSLVWNFQHDWATFRHVGATVQGGAAPQARAGGNFFPFLGEQAALLSPLLFILLLIAFGRLVKNRRIPIPLKFCGWLSFAILGTYLFFSLFQKMQGNWCDFAYPTAIVFLSWTWVEAFPRGQRWLAAGTALSILLIVMVFSVPYIKRIPFKYSLFRQNVGWHKLQEELAKSGYSPQRDFLFGDKYQTSSLLSFYGPGKKRAYFLNLQGIRHNQFSFWPGMDKEQLGKDGYFVTVENRGSIDKEKTLYLQRLKEFFNEVREVGVYPLVVQEGIPVKTAVIIKGIGYNGKTPPATLLY